MGSGGITMAGGTLAKPAGSSIAWTNSGLMTNTGTLNLADADISNQIDNRGTINLGGGLNFSQPFVNAGILEARSGTSNFAAGLQQNGGSLKLAGGNLQGPVTLNGGSLGGSGTIAGDLNIGSGTLSPGASPGKLVVTGNLNLTAGSSTLIEIGGAGPGIGYDYVQVLGTAHLAGTLTVVAYNGYTFQPGDAFTFMNFASTSGGFASTSLPAGLTYQSFASGLAVALPLPTAITTATTLPAVLVVSSLDRAGQLQDSLGAPLEPSVTSAPPATIAFEDKDEQNCP